MDIFSHAFWAGATYKGINEFALKPRSKKPLNFLLAAFWGAFPDIFSFAPIFVWIFGSVILGGLKLSDLPRPEAMEPLALNKFFIYSLTDLLYGFSHSAIIFLTIFAIVFLIFRRPIWEMAGWLLHILIDIPTHSYQFYPTPFLWPLSGVKFNGFSWATPWFLVLDYSLIFLVYLFFRLRKNKTQK